MTPHQRHLWQLSMVRIRIQHHQWVAIEAVLVPVLPQACAVGIWVCEGEDCEDGNGEDELGDEEGDDGARGAPAFRYVQFGHSYGRVVSLLERVWEVRAFPSLVVSY